MIIRNYCFSLLWSTAVADSFSFEKEWQVFSHAKNPTDLNRSSHLSQDHAVTQQPPARGGKPGASDSYVQRRVGVLMLEVTLTDFDMLMVTAFH